MNESLIDFVQSIDELEDAIYKMKSKEVVEGDKLERCGFSTLDSDRRVALLADVLALLEKHCPEVDRELVRKEHAFNNDYNFAEDESIQDK